MRGMEGAVMPCQWLLTQCSHDTYTTALQALLSPG